MFPKTKENLTNKPYPRKIIKRNIESIKHQNYGLQQPSQIQSRQTQKGKSNSNNA